jgi:YVTN family beta-propeller protein
VWAINRNADSVSIIDRVTGTVITTVPLKIKGKEIGKKPVGIAFSLDGQYAYVVCRNSDNLVVLDATTRAILDSIAVGNKPVALAISLDGERLYIVNRSSNDVAVIDVSIASTPVLLTKIAVGEEPEGIAILPDGNKLYVSNSKSNTVSVFQVLSGGPYLSFLRTIPVGQKPSGVAVTKPGSFSDGEYVYVANREDDTVSVIDTTNDTVIATIPVGKGPQGVAAGIVPTAP